MYTIVRNQMLEPGKFQYAVQQITDNDDDVKFDMVSLDGAKTKSNPLNTIRNCEMLLKDGVIMAINVDGDCVVKK